MSKSTEHHDTYCPECKWTGSNTDLIDHPFKNATLICPQCSSKNTVNVDEIDLDDFGKLDELEAALWKNGDGKFTDFGVQVLGSVHFKWNGTEHLVSSDPFSLYSVFYLCTYQHDILVETQNLKDIYDFLMV